MRDSNSRSIRHLADFTPAGWTSSLHLSKGVGSPEDVAWSQKCSIMVNISFDQTKVETSGTQTNKTLSNFEFCIITGPHIESGLEGLRFLCRPSVQSNWEATSARRAIIWFRQSGHLFDYVWMLLVLVRSWVKTTTKKKKILACWTATMTAGLIGVRLCAAKFSRVWDLAASVSTLTQRGLQRD